MGKGYRQTWVYIARIERKWPRLAALAKALCRRRGHEWSKTEWGWDGGGRLDVWCRWCNAFARIPMEEMPESGQKAFNLRAAVEQEFEGDTHA